MTITNSQSGTNIYEIAEGIFRINTPIPPSQIPGGFSFNQFLVADDESLLFHTGPRKMFPLVREAVAKILEIDRLRYIAFSHFESDECGSTNEFLTLASQAIPLCGKINAMINADMFDRPPRALSHGEELSLGKHRIQWFDTPHLPHGWECGYLMDHFTKTLFCGDLFTQGGVELSPVTESDILGPSEVLRKKMDYFSHAKNVKELIAPLAQAKPSTLACMHGSAWKGNGEILLRELAKSFDQPS